METNFYYLAAYFFIYSFLGWALEVSYQAVSKGIVVNRGFLNGPICPIYGCGVVSVLVLLEPYKENLLLLYLGGVAFTSLIELVGGWVLYRLFQMRWWDYSKEPYNLGGFVCLKFSLAWGICIILVVKVIQPLIEFNVKLFMDRLLGHILLFIVLAIFVADCVVTIMMVMHLNRDLKRMNAISKEMRRFSDELSKKIGNNSIKGEVEFNKLKDKSLQMKSNGEMDFQKFKAHSAKVLSAKEEELNALKKKLSAHTHFGYGRFYRAFPEMKHIQYNEELKQVINNLKERLDKKKTEERS